MQTHSLKESYDSFLKFVSDDIQGERKLANRKIRSAFIWCFLLPAALSVTMLLLIKFKFLPSSVRSYLDWTVLIFPVAYSLYILGSEALHELPQAFRRGGVAASLGAAFRESAWRERVCGEMHKIHGIPHSSWKWITESFRIDLRKLQYRTRYLTALAGAVFFLIMHGIDTLGGDDSKVVWLKNPVLDWMESSSSAVSQLVGLSLFLLLLYLSGNQTYHALERYLDSAELLANEKKD